MIAGQRFAGECLRPFSKWRQSCSFRKQAQLFLEVDDRRTVVSRALRYQHTRSSSVSLSSHSPRGGPPAEGKTTPTDSSIYGFIHPSFTGAGCVVVAVMINISSAWQRGQRGWRIMSGSEHSDCWSVLWRPHTMPTLFELHVTIAVMLRCPHTFVRFISSLSNTLRYLYWPQCLLILSGVMER